jgi:hypothetical protein
LEAKDIDFNRSSHSFSSSLWFLGIFYFQVSICFSTSLFSFSFITSTVQLLFAVQYYFHGQFKGTAPLELTWAFLLLLRKKGKLTRFLTTGINEGHYCNMGV